MKTNGILRTLLVTTSLATVSYGAQESRINLGGAELPLLDPNRRSLGTMVLTNMAGDVQEGISKDSQKFWELSKKVWNGQWESVAGVGIHQIIDHLNGEFLRRYTIERAENGEFNPESFKPFLKAFRDKATILLQGWLAKSGNSYAFNERTGEHYPIFSNTPFQQLANYMIPDCMPMKGLLISICNAAPINDYLGDKLDELAITCFFNLYHYQTGNSLKEGIVPSILHALKVGSKGIAEAAMTDYADHQSLPKLIKEKEDAYSPIFNYLKPHFDHLAREALNALFLDVSQSVSALILDKGVEAFLRNPLVENGMKGTALTLAGLSATAGWSVGGLVGGTVGGASGIYSGAGIGFGIGYKLADRLGGGNHAANFFGGVIGAPIGGMVGSLWGAAIGSWTGAVVGATTLSTGTYAYTPSIMTYMTKSLAKTTKQELNDQLKLLVDYHTYGFLPLTEAEHLLYHLNPNPTLEERILYHQDYAKRDQLLSQSFAGEFIRQFINLNSGYVSSILNGISDGYQSFINYCVANKDATVEEILEKANLTDDASGKPEEVDRDKVWREFVLRTAGSADLTPQDKMLKENLARFPSFTAKKQYLDQLSLYMNSLSSKDLKEFTGTFQAMKDSVRSEEEHIKQVHQTIEAAGARIAQIYQQTKGSALDEVQIGVIQASARTLWENATSAQLDQLVDMLKDSNFISGRLDEASIDAHYLKNMLNEYIRTTDLRYLAQNGNQKRFEALRGSSLTETLQDPQIVDLLRKIDSIGYQNLPQELQNLLEGSVIAKSRDIIQEAEQHELGLIQEKYESLLKKQLTIHSTRHFETHFKQLATEIAQKNWQASPNEAELSKDQLANAIGAELLQNESYRQFMVEIHKHYKGFFQDIASEIKGLILEVAQNFLDSLGSEFVDISEEPKKLEKSADASNVSPSRSLVSSLFSWGSEPSSTSMPENTENQPTIAIEFNAKISELKLYDQYDIGGYKLIEIINNLKDKEGAFKSETLGALNEDDLRTIYQAIQERKKQSLDKNDSLFLEKYKHEIMTFKMSKKDLANKLFYGYIEIIREIQKQNQQILESLQNTTK